MIGDADLGPVQESILRLLAAGSMTSVEICAAIALDRSQFSSVEFGLRRRGLIEREATVNGGCPFVYSLVPPETAETIAYRARVQAGWDELKLQLDGCELSTRSKRARRKG